MFLLWLIIFIIFLIIARAIWGSETIYYYEYWIIEDITEDLDKHSDTK